MKRNLFPIFLAVFLTMTTMIMLYSREQGTPGFLNLLRKIPEYGIQNVLVILNSESPYLFRKCVYYAGEYKIAEAVPGLIEILNDKTKHDNRVLIVTAIYKIKKQAGIEFIKKLTLYNNDSEIRKICSTIDLESVVSDK